MNDTSQHPKRPGRPGPRGGWLAPPFRPGAHAREHGKRGGIKSGEARRRRREREAEALQSSQRRRPSPQPVEPSPAVEPTPSEPQPPWAGFWPGPPGPPLKRITIVPRHGGVPPADGSDFFYHNGPWPPSPEVVRPLEARGFEVVW